MISAGYDSLGLRDLDNAMAWTVINRLDYVREKLKDALSAIDGPKIAIVKRPPGILGIVGFVGVARRWVT